MSINGQNNGPNINIYQQQIPPQSLDDRKVKANRLCFISVLCEKES